MYSFISQITLKLSKFLLLFLLLLTTSKCFALQDAKRSSSPLLITPNKSQILLRTAITKEQQIKGLSGVLSESFKHNEGMLFLNKTDDFRTFWMIDTFFNMDIYFLNKDLKILYIDRNIKYHPGIKNQSQIEYTKTIMCRHVLELRADSKISKKLKINDKLQWKFSKTLSEILLSTHPQQ